MYRVTLKNGKTVGYYFADELGNLSAADEDYSVIRLPSNKDSVKYVLYRNGFAFADRSIETEIPLGGLSYQAKSGGKFSYTATLDWDADVLYDIAMPYFNEDCRFAVDFEKKDKDLKNELLYKFIKDLKRQNFMATCTLCDGETVGFNLWSISNDGSVGRIFLGAMSNRYKGTGVALYLYLYTAQCMKERGVKVLADKISTANISSMNLHVMLSKYTGGRYKAKNYEDWYIKDGCYMQRIEEN